MRTIVLAVVCLGCGSTAASSPPPITSRACMDPMAHSRGMLEAQGLHAEVGSLEGRPFDGGDLDGDGVAETVIAVTSLAGVTGNEVLHLYLSNAGCFRWGAELFGESVQVLETVHEGVRDLSTYADAGCASMAGTVTVLVWDGTGYVSDPARSVSCACPATPEEERSPLRDPRCPGLE